MILGLERINIVDKIEYNLYFHKGWSDSDFFI